MRLLCGSSAAVLVGLAGLLLLAAPARADPWGSGEKAGFNLSITCPGNLIQNGGFEEPNIYDTKNFPKAPWGIYNSRWGWYSSIPHWTWNCLRVDWPPRALEMQRGAVATAPEGFQNLELLPNATGVACQTVDVVPGAKYKLSFQYGRLQTYAWRNEYKGQFIKFETKMDVLARDGSKPAPAEIEWKKGGYYPFDKQGFNLLVVADTRTHANQWQRYETEITGPPSGKLQLVFTTSMRPKECGSCGSLLDAVCLQKA